eukprot:TRINITY_DN53880_c0_g1_i1.p1 TRINITY_DN53880_c0_g1~~TRINITY_DN53880_c0_g1_i1.p1  ORF type:complete len:201 (+),score=19.43 TRINITY_DN53880_c0_g1_i1:79-681(+)
MSRLFVRGFHWDADEETVREHMSQAGHIESIYSRDRGRWLVTYSTREEAQIAIDVLHGSVPIGDTRYIECKIDGNGSDFAPIDKSRFEPPPKRKANQAPDTAQGPSKSLKSMQSTNATQMPRRFIGDDHVQGTVWEWDATSASGWIKPDKGIFIPAANEQGGYVYVRLADVLNSEPLTVGQTVIFKAFSDARCCGAAGVC